MFIHQIYQLATLLTDFEKISCCIVLWATLKEGAIGHSPVAERGDPDGKEFSSLELFSYKITWIYTMGPYINNKNTMLL